MHHSLTRNSYFRPQIVVMLTLASVVFFGVPSRTNSNSSATKSSHSSRLRESVNPLFQSTQKIVFGSLRNGNHDIFVMDLDGSNQTNLTNNPAYDDQPKWSADGSRIAFMSNRDGNFEIYSMNADGSGQTRLTNNPAADGFPSWSPDGTKIAFVSGDLRDPRTFEIFVMNADGSNRTRLTNDLLIDGVPAWSPDGTKIVFMSGTTTFNIINPNSFEIFVMNANGSNRVQLTSNAVADGQPSYSPNGAKILFASGDFLNPAGIEIFTMNPDGSNRIRITNNGVTEGFPAWSPDGSRIIFASGSIADENTVELFVMNADGSNPTRLTNNSVLDWFPDLQPPFIPPTIQVGPGSLSASEGVGSMPVVITRSGIITGTSTVSFTTSDTAGANPCSTVNGAASSRCDYLTTLGTLQFASGEGSKTILIPIVDDVYAEGNETFTITLSNATGGTLGSPSTATLTITDNDSPNPPLPPNPIDTTSFFVRQQYIDFLNREPDASGFAFWQNEINSCGADAQCIEIKRINVSAAFFLSIEFQQTGYLVERIYKTSFGSATGTSTLGGLHTFPVPIVRLNEFLSDTQEIGKGVVVGQTGWEILLENNKQAFTSEFVQRPTFTALYPTTMPPFQFVNKLNDNAGGPLSSGEVNVLVNQLFNNQKTRAQALRQVADDPDLISAEFNRAFVLMQYFGYLRRNPNDPLDSDYTGYDFWLGKLNQFGGNFVNAEMVKAFIQSDEYRHRFGP